MAQTMTGNRLDRPVDPAYDHVLGSGNAEITLVEYGSYACPHCRAANERIAEVRDQFGDRLRYVFRHRPLTGNDLARRAAELVERARRPEQFWEAHVELMTRSATLTEDDLVAVAADLRSRERRRGAPAERRAHAKERVEADEASARASGVSFTPTFFINGRRYDGPWDESSFADAMLGSLGHRVRSAALDFASWAPSAGVLLLLASIVAVVLTNSAAGARLRGVLASSTGDSTFGRAPRSSCRCAHWINDGLLTVFFLVVGLEIKREFTVGHLASRRSAALPIAAAIGGMVVPALSVLHCRFRTGPWSHGWGVPMATDTAFAVALIVMMGRRVPVELRIFLTAAAIVDDIGAIVVVAHLLFRRSAASTYLAGAAALTGVLALLNRSHVYRATPYVLVGVALWVCVHAGGLHATLAGVLLALFIPTRPPPDLHALMTQANAIIAAEAQHGGEVLRHGPSTAGVARARCDPRPHRVAGGPDAATRRAAIELPGAAAVRAGERRRRAEHRRVRRPRAADARHHLRAVDRQAARAGARLRAGRALRRSRSSRRSTRGGSSPARARSPASASPCRCSSPARHLRPSPISRPRRSRCSPRRCCRRSSAWRSSGMHKARATTCSGSYEGNSVLILCRSRLPPLTTQTTREPGARPVRPESNPAMGAAAAGSA